MRVIKSRKEVNSIPSEGGMSYGANFLLNVGPMPNGKIQPEHVELLRQVGEWTKQYGETVYGTRGGPLSAREWGVMTQKGNKIYVSCPPLITGQDGSAYATEAE